MRQNKKIQNGFNSINEVIVGTENLKKLQPIVEKYKALKIWESVAKSFLADLEKQTKAMDLKKGVLYVACLSKEAAYQIKVLKEKIINALNTILGKRIVFAIYIET